MNNNISAIVLAGGKSSRMGTDKALIPIQGIPMLQRVCNVAISCVNIVYIITPWPENYQHLLLPGCEFILETPKFNIQCPLTAFSQSLERINTEWVLLLACDLPNLKIEILQNWVNRLDNVAEEAIATLVQSSIGWEPLCGFYRTSSLPLLQEFINQGGTSFQKWLSQHPVDVLPLSEPEILFNCNTPEDLALTQDK